MASNSDTKRKIIETYLKSGEKEGFDNISLRKIAEKVGISKATIFSHFSNSEEMENESIDYAYSALEKTEFSLNLKARNFEELMFDMVNGFMDVFSRFPVNSFLSMVHQKEFISGKFGEISKKIDLIIGSRLTVALDFSVQRLWIDIPYTDEVAALFIPLIRKILVSPETDNQEIEDRISALSKLLSSVH